MIVPVPVSVPSVAFDGLDSTTVNCFGRLNRGVPKAVTVIVLLVWPGSNVSVPLVAA